MSSILWSQLTELSKSDRHLSLNRLNIYCSTISRSISWSPKGKQIVVAFANGKLIQFKPDMKPARVIDCPPNICEGPFDVIALQWLSTYQFAAVFLTKNQDATPGNRNFNSLESVIETLINFSSSHNQCT